MDDLFESAWLKWAWAVVNANVLADNVNALANQPNLSTPIAMRQDYDAKCHCIILSVVDFQSPFPDNLWGLILGDVVQNFRSALDHVAWALVKLGRAKNLTDRQERQIYFPITSSPAAFRNAVPLRLPGVRRADLAKIRACQPYLKGKRNLSRHVVWVVGELSRLDKHRTIQPIYAIPDRAGYDIGEQTDCIYRRMRRRSARRVLKPGTELTRLYVKRTGPEPFIDVQPHFSMDPAVYDPRLTLQQFLVQTIRAVSEILRLFAPQPESAKRIISTPLPASPFPQPHQSGPHQPPALQTRDTP